MEHEDAVRSRNAERYVAGELPAAERDAFEEHFFDCQECAEEVRWEHLFSANARALVAEMPVLAGQASIVEKVSAWFKMRPGLALSLATNAALAVGLAYLLMNANQFKPEVMPSYFAPPQARSGEEAPNIPPGTGSFLVRFLAPDHTTRSYTYEILDAAGHRESVETMTAPKGGGLDLSIPVPVRSLAAGLHTLLIRGSSNSEIVGRFQFRNSR